MSSAQSMDATVRLRCDATVAQPAAALEPQRRSTCIRITIQRRALTWSLLSTFVFSSVTADTLHYPRTYWTPRCSPQLSSGHSCDLLTRPLIHSNRRSE